MHETKIKSKKRKRVNCCRCVKCGLLTYNPKRVCVLCETGINKLYKELKELCEEKANGKKHSKQKTVKVTLPVCS